MKLKEVLEKSIQFFKDKKLETPRLDAELLIAHALKIERMQLYLKHDSPLNEKEVTLCREVIRRRSQGEPVAYITNEKGFYGISFQVGAGVLIPRPETEHLVELALEFIKSKKIEKPCILDLGAGTGCIGFSILKNCADATLVSIERSETAFRFLKTNCENLDLVQKSKILLKNINEIQPTELQSFDIILGNPPYLAEDDVAVEEMVKKYEPNEALFAKNKGVDLLLKWSSQFAQNLNSPGLMAFEMGYLQGAIMENHFNVLKIFSNVQIVKDLSGLDRIIKGIR